MKRELLIFLLAGMFTGPLFSGWCDPAGFTPDMQTGKESSFNNHPAVSSARVKKRDTGLYSSRQGDLQLTIGMPVINTSLTHIDRADRYDTNTGFWGLSLGADYYYADSRSLAWNATTTSNFWAFILPAAIFTNRRQRSVHFSLYDNVHRNRFSFGYGVNVSYNWWAYGYKGNDEDDEDKHHFGTEDFSQHRTGIGPMINVYWEAFPKFRIGLVYRSSLYGFDAHPRWNYQHAICLDVKFGFNLIRPGR